MADPLTLLSVGSTAIGALGSLFGSGSKQEIPPELREVYNLLMNQYREGLSDKTVAELTGRAKRQIGNEAGALGALTESRLTRAGAGTGVKQAALNRINTGRLRGIGEATTQINLADEEAKMRALEQLRTLAPIFGSPEFTKQYGEGFSQLFGAGLNFLLNKPGGDKNNTSTQDIGYTQPYTPEGYNFDIFNPRPRRNFLDIYDTPYSGNPNIYGS